MGVMAVTVNVSEYVNVGVSVVMTTQPKRPVSRRLDYGLRRGRTFAAKNIDAIKNPMAM